LFEKEYLSACDSRFEDVTFFFSDSIRRTICVHLLKSLSIWRHIKTGLPSSVSKVKKMTSRTYRLEMFLFISVIISTGKWKDENETKSTDQRDVRLPISKLLLLDKSQMNKFQLSLTFSQRSHMLIVEKCLLCICRKCIRTNRYGAVTRDLRDTLFLLPQPGMSCPEIFWIIPFVLLPQNNIFIVILQKF